MRNIKTDWTNATRWVLAGSFCLAGLAAPAAAAWGEVSLAQRPIVAVFDFDLGIEITTLSTVRTVTKELPPEEEAQLVQDAVREITGRARRQFYDRLQTSGCCTMVAIEEVDATVKELGLPDKGPFSPAQWAGIRRRLGADLVVQGTVLDYGKVRWQWLAGGMAVDMTWESIVIGAATAWNPIAIFANLGFELMTSPPVWFGGGYLFGVAFRPVRVEARALDVETGAVVWEEMESAAYARDSLKALPEKERDKKEAQLGVNLRKAMDALVDSFLAEHLSKGEIWARRPVFNEAGE